MSSKTHTRRAIRRPRVAARRTLLTALAALCCLTACDDGPDPTPMLDPVCGDAIISVGEQCDDGNTNDGDGCDSRCGFEETAACGNGDLDSQEECDDGNRVGGDGCDARCRVEPLPPLPRCGDGVIDPGEECDDGNFIQGDGCDADCRIEDEPEPARCGDGLVDVDETCDDGNRDDGDGCDADCQIEPEPEPEPEPARCGDGTVDAGEACDDGNTNDGDGCDAACRVEPEPARCGDGTVDAGEACDDGNTNNGDGCDAACRVERMGPRPGIQAITQIGDEHVYFFSAGDYARYTVANARIGDDYPLAVLGQFSHNWPRGWDEVDAAVNLGNGNLYFFKGREYIRYNIAEARVADGYPLPIAGQFSGNWPNWDRVDGAVNLGNGSIYFFRDREYMRYDIEDARIAANYPLPIAGRFSGNWPNWPRVDGAVNYGNGSAYFFYRDQYIRYDIAAGAVPPNYPLPIEHQFSGNWTPPTEW